MDHDGANVLVTGAGGFIGSHLVEHLVRGGARVTALVHYNHASTWGNLDRAPADVLSKVEVVPSDITDAFAVDRLVEGKTHVYHLAALIGIPYSYVAPDSYVNVNIRGTVNVLEACRRHRVERLVHTSTSETYGTARYTPIDEEHPLQGQSPYSASKIAADKLAESYYRSFGTPVVTMRPFNTYGPRQSARAVIPTIITQALTGKTVELGSLTPIRDMNFVTDTVRGFALAGLTPNVDGEVINLASGRGVTIGELAEQILSLLDSGAELVQDKSRVRPEASEVFALLGDATKAERLLGWRSRMALEDGLQLTIEYMREHLDAYRPRSYTL